MEASRCDPGASNADAIDNPVYCESTTPAITAIQGHRAVEESFPHYYSVIRDKAYPGTVTPTRLEDHYEQPKHEPSPYLTPISLKGCRTFSHEDHKDQTDFRCLTLTQDDFSQLEDNDTYVTPQV